MWSSHNKRPSPPGEGPVGLSVLSLAATAPPAVRLPPGAANKGEDLQANGPEYRDRGYLEDPGRDGEGHAAAIGRHDDGNGNPLLNAPAHVVISCLRGRGAVYRE